MEKRDLEQFKDEIVHQFGVIAEDIKSDIKLVAEQVGVNTEKIEDLTEKVDTNTEQIKELTVRVDANTEQIKELTVKVDANTEKIEEMTTTLHVHTEKITGLQTGMNSVQETLGVMKLDLEFIKHELKEKISRDEFAALEHRLSMLESKVAAARL